jgi:hypothetical protein
MRQTLKALNERLRQDPGYCFYRWEGVPTDEHLLIRLDRLYLNLVHFQPEGCGRYRRILGYREKAGTAEERVVFTPTLLRIKCGSRRGRLLPSEAVMPGETYVPTGISKQLRKGAQSWCFRDDRVGDCRIMESLQELQDKDSPECSVLSFPEFYLVASDRSDDVQLRNTEEALRWLKSVLKAHYDTARMPTENMLAFADIAARPLLNNKRAWPYRYCCRAGVVAADFRMVTSWVRTPWPLVVPVTAEFGLADIG